MNWSEIAVLTSSSLKRKSRNLSSPSMSKLIKLRNIKRALTVQPDQSVKYLISGRVKSFRQYKKFNFIDLVDGSTNQKLQVFITRDALKKPELGSYLTCLGSLSPSPGSQQDVEFKVDEVKFLGPCDPCDYPLATSNAIPADQCRRYTHLRPREPSFASMLRVRAELELGLHLIMRQMDFIRVHTPILTSNDSEASSDLFLVERTKLNTQDENSDILPDANDGRPGELGEFREIAMLKSRSVKDNYFKKDVYLVTSAQLHLESLAASLSRVYSLSNAFRAENSITSRHLCEFMMFEAEESGADSVETLTNRIESIIKFVGQYLSQVSEHKSDFTNLIKEHKHDDLFNKLVDSPFVHMTYKEAVTCLREKFQVPLKHGQDIGRNEEKQLLQYSDNVPIFIRNYPKRLKPFYMKCDSEQKEALCFDLIAPLGGEICGGSLREESFEQLQNNLRLSHHERTLRGGQSDRENTADRAFEWYLETRKFGTFPHGGFGVGIERLLQSLLGIRNIRDTIPFPRRSRYCPM